MFLFLIYCLKPDRSNNCSCSNHDNNRGIGILTQCTSRYTYPAIIRPTSPRDIIPIPTFIALLLSFENINDGMPHPINLVIIAIATIKPARNNTLRLIPLRSTCAPMIAKNKGAKNYF
jgi:hypothetical protein